MNSQAIQNKLNEYYNTATPEQVVKEFEDMDVEFVEFVESETYWLWYWGWDQDDLTQHSTKLRFDDFNEMKTFSSKHSFVSQHLKPNYWSNYESYTTITENS